MFYRNFLKNELLLIVEVLNLQIKRDQQIINIVGPTIEVGDLLPNAQLIDRNHQKVELKDYLKGTTVVSIVPDINTKTCDIQTSRFASIALEQNYTFVTISTNSPEDIMNWCQAANVDMIYLSDVERHFSQAAGLLMAEYDKLARTVLVIDGQGVIKYMEVVPDMRDEPNYTAALEAAAKL